MNYSKMLIVRAMKILSSRLAREDYSIVIKKKNTFPPWWVVIAEIQATSDVDITDTCYL